MQEDRPGFDAYAAARMGHLRATAYLLCGDWYRAEDLAQDALGRLFVHWRRASRADNLDAYARRTLVNAYLADRRRSWRRDVPTDVVPEPMAPAVESGDREDVRAALANLSPSQRAIVVLRFWEDLSVEQTAQVLGCSTGNVKSQSSRGLARLREALGSGSTDNNDLGVS